MRKLSVKKINEKLIELISCIKFAEWTTPLNDSAQKKIFIEKYNKGEIYNPQYKYRKPKSIAKIREGLIDLKSKVNIKLYNDAIQKTLKTLDLLESIGDDSIQVLTHGVPDQNCVEFAKKIFPKTKARTQRRIIAGKDARVIFVEYIKSYGIRDWKVIIKRKMVAKAYVDTSKKTLYIASRNYSMHEINNLISHEIMVHVLRAVNGHYQKEAIFSFGTHEYLKTEEGLAIMMEQLTGNYNPLRFKFFAARIIAADLALTKSFYQIFHILHTRYKLSKNNSYIITKRVKRTLVDTANIGGYIKDHLYFEGFLMIKNFMQGGGDIRPLFAGKISLDEINMVKRGRIRQPKFIPAAVVAHYNYRSEQTLLL